MTQLSDYFPTLTADDFYTPAMMKYDGSTGYYSKTYTSAGNKVTLVARFKHGDFTGGLQKGIMRADDPNSYQRGTLFVSASDTAIVDYRSKLQFLVKNSANTVICRVISFNNVLDNETHTVFASFDGDTGIATFLIDGVDADDTGNASRVAPTTGTLGTGVGNMQVGLIAFGYEFAGDIGFVGYRDAYLTNWSDFMDTNGNPKALDESTWTEWGAQPLFWNPHGYMEDNRGSAGNMTKNGTIIVGDGGAV